MRAIVVERAGGPEVLELREAEAPRPGPGELLVETAATGVNFIEIYRRSGVYPVDFPDIPGSEASGTVVAVGDGVAGFAAGDRVATSAGTGTYAEHFAVAAEQAALVPDGIDLRTAAALPLQGATAHYLAASASRPEAGDTVLVHAGAGGVGLLLTQLLTARGVRVISTASSDAKRELSLAAGAEHAIGYEGFADRARELTGGEGVAVVYDGVGESTFDGSLSALRVRGGLVLFGGASGQVPPFDLQRLNAGGSLSVTRPSLGDFMRTVEERAWRYRELFAAVLDGTLELRIGARFPLAEAAEAHRALASRGTTGKLLLEP
ncbi:quinone oxidoreductase [Leucobacter weissii]|uniref:Quinone oxidoreductase n=1 Tax=Leucobacter weissii TaxID=1983706 RepID=A0A939MPU9_9MICO|nr:quinone oxidoreductase [Leucobacter weissii]MBO1902747.1 quinone oxidoreductase [Leucobacter weissii]